MKIIGLGHKSRVGKDEFAKFLMDAAIFHVPKSRIKIAGFSDKLKETVHLLYKHIGVKDAEHYERNPKDREIVLFPDGRTVVDLWIDFGNHSRKYDPDIWVNALFGNSDFDLMIIKDTRFPNEVEAIRKRHGCVVKCERPGVLGRLDSDADNALNNFNDWDHIVQNDATLREWYVTAQNLIKKLYGPK